MKPYLASGAEVEDGEVRAGGGKKDVAGEGQDEGDEDGDDDIALLRMERRVRLHQQVPAYRALS